MKQVKPATSTSSDKKHTAKPGTEIKGDFLTSEKDEVKKAERKLQNNQKKSN
jgi:hypothetical protein